MADGRMGWVVGDRSGLDIPSDGSALREGGEAFLTHAFHASGVLPADNRVARIDGFEEFSGGGTGSKALLTVEYETPLPGLQRDLFVKFSRNFDDPIRDGARYMLRPEIEFAALSRSLEFPVAVAECFFADFHQASGTGILITQRIAYGSDGVEPQYIKCMDHLLPDPLEHYRAIMRALGKLAGSHKAGLLPQSFYRAFPFDLEQAIAEDPLRYRDKKLDNRLARLVGFAEKYPHLLPENVRSREFLDRFVEEVPRFVSVEHLIRRQLFDMPDYIALCHWNANIDNAWFWRNGSGELECGLIDWGAVGQMSVAKSIYGAFSGANSDLWDNHLDDILKTFISTYACSAGASLDLEELRSHVLLFVGLMGVTYLLDAPAIIERSVPDLGSLSGPLDPDLLDIEDARVQLHMLTMFLNQWQSRDIGQIQQSYTDTIRHSYSGDHRDNRRYL